MSLFHLLSFLLIITLVRPLADDLLFQEVLDILPRNQTARVDAVNYNSDGSRLIGLASNTISIWSRGPNGLYTQLQHINST
jgi:hypothetical protein